MIEIRAWSEIDRETWLQGFTPTPASKRVLHKAVGTWEPILGITVTFCWFVESCREELNRTLAMYLEPRLGALPWVGHATVRV